MLPADRTMLCAYCGATRPWPADFPLRLEAKCRVCFDADEQAEHEASEQPDWTMAFVVAAVAFGIIVLGVAFFARGSCG